VQAIVAIHDISPIYQKQIDKIKGLLKKEGIKDFSYLVIPKFRNRENLRIGLDKKFCSWLTESGKDLLLHGLTHWKRLSEDEFSRIRYQTAMEKLEAGKKMFEEAFEREPEGFIPPMWMMSKHALRAVKDSGFRYTSHQGTIHDLARDKKIKTSIVLNGGIFLTPSVLKSIVRIETKKPLQIAFHPKDTVFRTQILKKFLRMMKSKGYEFKDYRRFIREN